MSYTEQGRVGAAFGAPERTYDPLVNPEYFHGVLSRRILAFLIDVTVLTVPVILASILILLFGIVTLGFGWMLFWFLSPATVVWAVLYFGMTLGGPASATLGMRAVDLEMRTVYGGRVPFLVAATHVVLYWISVSALSPFVLLVALFNGRRRLLHDVFLGTVVVNTEARAEALRRAWWRSGTETRSF